MPVDKFILVNWISNIALLFIISYLSYVWYKEKQRSRIATYIGAIGTIYLVFSVLGYLWLFNILQFSPKDFILIKSIFIFIESLLFFGVIYYISYNKNLLYLLTLFLLSVFAMSLGFYKFFLIISIISYLLMIIIFLNFVMVPDICLRRPGYLGIMYSSISILLLGLMILGFDNAVNYWFFPNLLLFSSFMYMLLDIKYCRFKDMKKFMDYERGIVLSFIRYFVFIITITGFIMVSVVGIHELGHAISSQLFGCDYSKAVIYETKDNPHTEVICEGSFNQVFVTLGGIALTLFLGFVLFLTGKRFTRDIAYLIFGFSLLVSRGDLMELNINESFIVAIFILSLVILTGSVIKMALDHIEGDFCKVCLENRK